MISPSAWTSVIGYLASIYEDCTEPRSSAIPRYCAPSLKALSAIQELDDPSYYVIDAISLNGTRTRVPRRTYMWMVNPDDPYGEWYPSRFLPNQSPLPVSLTHKTLTTLLTPQTFLQWGRTTSILQRAYLVWMALAARPKTPASALERLATTAQVTTRPATLDPLHNLLLETLQRHPLSSGAFLESLSDNQTHQSYVHLAQHPNATPLVLVRCAAHTCDDCKDMGSWILHYVARHPRTPSDILATLATNPYPFIRDHALRHPATPPAAVITGTLLD